MSWLSERELLEFEASAKREVYESGDPHEDEYVIHVLSLSRILRAGTTVGAMKKRGWAMLQDNRAGMFRGEGYNHASGTAPTGGASSVATSKDDARRRRQTARAQ